MLTIFLNKMSSALKLSNIKLLSILKMISLTISSSINDSVDNVKL